jgi:hypothetical protein
MHYATILRWIISGVSGVKLRAVRVGGVWCTRETWLMEFFEASANAKAGIRPAPPAAANAETDHELRALGAL